MSPIQDNAIRTMPDVANDARPSVAGSLQWVGMGQIEMPVAIATPDGSVLRSGAKVDAFVNLIRPDVRGIHMSRLYLHLDRALAQEPISPSSLRRLLREFLDSHQDISDRAMIKLGIDYLVRRPALVSNNTGWKAYPVEVTAQLHGQHFEIELCVDVIYSSTCPCSAALARQLIQEQFQSDFTGKQKLNFDDVMQWLGSEKGIMATPHSQRSRAQIKVKLAHSFQNLPVIDIIDCAESALKTPVQTAVKREDEQAFAKLNGQNLMFCEDAARRLQAALNADERIVDFWVRASHFESLHPHDAVAVATKGMPKGYGPNG